jgi:glutamate-1-semialdehyde 2,1-aminomutase
MNDETHSFSTGPGGATAAWGLDPDAVTIGKAIGGGIPVGAYGPSAALSAALSGRTDLDLVDVGGPGAARRAIGGRAAPVATARVGSDFCHEYPCVTHRAS